MARVSVVIPTWNGSELLDRALGSLQRQSWRDFEVVVVDNASADDTLAMLEREHPDVRVVRLPENRGFAAAVNEGIDASEGEIVALLNNDAEADPEWLARLVDASERHPGISSFASKMLDYHRRDVIDSAGDRLGVFASQRGHGMPDGPEYAEPREVLSPCAGAAAYRRDLFDDVGTFDEGYFAYFEDVDLGLRARLAGHRCLYVPDAVVYHHGSATARRISDRAFYLRSRNAMILGFRYLPVERLLAFGPLLVVWPLVRAVLDGQRMTTALRAVRDFIVVLPGVIGDRRRLLGERRIPMSGLRRALASPLSRNRPGPTGLPVRVDERRRARPVDVVIVNWNGRDYLPACLAALRASTVPLRITVVDNASEDGSVEYLSTEHPDVELVALAENTGYAAGANEGLRRAEGELALVMNPDVLVEPEYVERLQALLEGSTTVGIAQGKLYGIVPEDFRTGTSPGRTGRTLDSAGHVIPRSRRVFDRGQGRQDGPEFAEPAAVFSASGAAMVLRRAMWEDVAPDGEVFDESFFAYKEEIDLCWRARWLGWEVAYLPTAVAGHVRAWTGKGLPPKDRIPAMARRHSWKNHYLLMLKNDRLGHLLLHLPWIAGWEVVRQAYALTRDPAVYPSYLHLARLLPRALRRRRDILSRRRADVSEMRRWLGGEPRPMPLGTSAEATLVASEASSP